MKDVGTINNRITVTNGKFRTTKGTEDATCRYGVNIPVDTDTKFSPGYAGAAIINLKRNFKKESK